MSIFVHDIKVMRAKESSHIKGVKVKLVAIFVIIDIDLISFYLNWK